MNFKKLALTGAIALGTTLTSLAAYAQQTITVNIGSSHPVTNIWAYAMKEVFQPEVDRLLKEGGNKWHSVQVQRDPCGRQGWHRRCGHGGHGLGELLHAAAERDLLHAVCHHQP